MTTGARLMSREWKRGVMVFDLFGLVGDGYRWFVVGSEGFGLEDGRENVSKAHYSEKPRTKAGQKEWYR